MTPLARRSTWLGPCLAVATFVASAAPAAASHGCCDYFNVRWASEGYENRSVVYRYMDGFPSGNSKKLLFRQAARNFNAQKGTSYMYWAQRSDEVSGSQDFGFCPFEEDMDEDNYQANTIGWGSVNPGPDTAYAGTNVCVSHADVLAGFPSHIHSIKIRMSAEVAGTPWDLDAPEASGYSTVDPGHADFVGVAMHELMHAAGFYSVVDEVFNHFPEGDDVACPGTPTDTTTARSTMCDNDLVLGNTYWRTFAEHDLFAFRDTPEYD